MQILTRVPLSNYNETHWVPSTQENRGSFLKEEGVDRTHFFMRGGKRRVWFKSIMFMAEKITRKHSITYVPIKTSMKTWNLGDAQTVQSLKCWPWKHTTLTWSQNLQGKKLLVMVHIWNPRAGETEADYKEHPDLPDPCLETSRSMRQLISRWNKGKSRCGDTGKWGMDGQKLSAILCYVDQPQKA